MPLSHKKEVVIEHNFVHAVCNIEKPGMGPGERLCIESIVEVCMIRVYYIILLTCISMFSHASSYIHTSANDTYACTLTYV